MLFLPIVERELRTAARSWRAYYDRVWTGLGALAVCAYLVYFIQGSGGAMPVGAYVLNFTGLIALGLCLSNGVHRTCDCISSEKRDDTLGLLFLTHLKGWDIVLGKIMANSLRTILLVIGVLPILSIPVLLGGVSGRELVRIPICLLNSLFLAVSIGVLISVLGRKQRTASFVAGFVVVFLALLLPLAATLVARFTSRTWLADLLYLPSPFFTLQSAFGSMLAPGGSRFWLSVAVQFSFASLCLTAACLLAPHTWQVRAQGSLGEKIKGKIDAWILGAGASRRARRARMLDRSPIFWLSCRSRFAPLSPLFFAILSLGVTVGCMWYFSVSLEPSFGIFIAVLAINDIVMRARAATVASYRLGTDRQSGALEMILSTPITIREILRGQWMAVRHTLLWTYIPLLLLYLAVLVEFVQMINGSLGAGLFFILLSAVDFISMGWVAMWKGMRVKNVAQAPGRALLRVFFFPWVGWFMLVPVLVEIGLFQELVGTFGGHVAVYGGVLVWAINSIWAQRTARRNLLLHFREAATDRYNFERRMGLGALWRRLPTQYFPTFSNFLRKRRPPVLS